MHMDIVHRRVIKNCSSLPCHYSTCDFFFIARVLVLVPVLGIQLEMLGLTCQNTELIIRALLTYLLESTPTHTSPV